MAASRNLMDLVWLLQALKSESLNLQNISFYLSQPSSGCYQETENSMKINISRDSISYFSQFLMVLGTTKANQRSLGNLEFHQIEWELQQLLDLAVLLECNSNIKLVMFRRNRFGRECISELSQIFKRNGVMIKEVMFTESNIGSVGAGYLACALKMNDSLEELQIWEDSIGSKGAEELSKMIEVNSILRLLTIFDSNPSCPLLEEKFEATYIGGRLVWILRRLDFL